MHLQSSYLLFFSMALKESDFGTSLIGEDAGHQILMTLSSQYKRARIFLGVIGEGSPELPSRGIRPIALGVHWLINHSTRMIEIAPDMVLRTKNLEMVKIYYHETNMILT